MAAQHLRLNSIVGVGLVILCLIFILPSSSRAAVGCPKKDLAGHALTGGGPGGGSIFVCNYTPPGFCTYQIGGALFSDRNQGFCPLSAASLGESESPTPVPALSPWGLALAVILMTSCAVFALRRRADRTKART
jgi:hypothetical protein